MEDENKAKYIPPMIKILKEIQKIKSSKAGLIDNEIPVKNWKHQLELVLSGNHPWFNWKEIATRKGLDGNLMKEKLELLNIIISSTNDFLEDNYSLLHTDFNQRNLFVNQDKVEIAGVIDWSEAMFGDPLYDFARVKIFCHHFQIDLEILNKELNLNPGESKKLNLYFLIQILCYLNWYSEELNEFSISRIELHQNILRDFNWKKFI